MKRFQILLSLFAVVGVASGEANVGFDLESSDPEVCCVSSDSKGGFFFDFEALYLRAYQGGLSSLCDVLETQDTIIGDTTVSHQKGHGQEPDFRWDWGFRIGAGYEFACSDCGIRAYWTHFDNSSKKRHQHKRNENRWKIDFDVADIVFRCDFDLASGATVSPFAGVKIANIQQKLHTHFVGLLDTFPTDSFDHVKQRLEGVGPLIGVEGSWDWKCGFSLYGNLDFALLYGNTHVRASETDIFHTGINFGHLKNHKDAYQFVLDMGIGIEWKKCFCGNKFLVVQVGLEDHRYFNHNQFCDFGDLSLDGVKLGVILEF